MKICVIGNSHTKCLARAWDDLKALYPSASMIFHAYITNYYARFSVERESGLLTISGPWVREQLANSSGGNGDIDFRDYDICLIAGGFPHEAVMELGQLGGQSRKAYSRQAMNVATEDLYKRSHVDVLVPKIRALTDIPIYLFHDPMLAHEEGMKPEEQPEIGAGFDYVQGVDLLNAYARFWNGPTSVLQPAESIAWMGASKYELCVGKRTPSIYEVKAGFDGELLDDRVHMEADYGKMRLSKFFEQLKIVPASVTK